jgi:imidazolonepropionase-like amidohydrolase
VRSAFALAVVLVVCASAAAAPQKSGTLIVGSRVFNGERMLSANAVLVAGGKVVAVGSRATLAGRAKKAIAFRNATVLPGFIDLHVHAESRSSLKLGVTTIRNLGEPLLGLPPSPDKPGWQRIRSAGPIVSVPGGYPSVYWGGDIQAEVTSPADAADVVNMLVDHGADLIKIAIETGPGTWPTLSLDEVKAIVAAAHARGRIVTAHVSDPTEAREALDGGVDELAHLPCGQADPELMRELARHAIPIVGTFDVEKRCPFKVANGRSFVQAGGKLLYGTDFSLVPPGIDVRELKLMAQAGLRPVQALAAATGEAGRELGENLGMLVPGAPADVVVVRGDPRKNLGVLGRALLVLAGGKRVLEGIRKVYVTSVTHRQPSGIP